MKESVNKDNIQTPILFPISPEEFWNNMKKIIHEEIISAQKIKPSAPEYETPGLIYKPLFKTTEVCKLFQISKPTIYDWIKHGKLKPYKIRSRVYFLWQDIQNLLNLGEVNKVP